MKKILVFLLVGMWVAPTFAYQSISESIYNSSFTNTNDTTVLITSRPGAELFGVAVTSPNPAGLLTIWNSNGVINSTIAIVNLGTVQNPQFLVKVSSGITYSTVGQTPSGVTILWRDTNLK